MSIPGKTPFNWIPTGATTFAGRDGRGGIEGDSGFRLNHLERRGCGRPTLVIDCGHSQSLGSMRHRVKWFRESDHQVQIVLLVKLFLGRYQEPSQRVIWIEKYTDSVLRQTITMAPNANTKPITYSVTGGSLLLEFALLRLRPAVPGSGEHDIIVTEDDLAQMAEQL